MTSASAKVKICGITQLEDAELAFELGAWALGMVFYEPSPRRCSLAQAEAIASRMRRRPVELCGVFVNAPMDELIGMSERLGLSMLQLHGDEGPTFCAEVARRTGVKVVKALQVADVGDIRDASRFHTDFHLFDARVRAPVKQDLRGGTGETFDWGLLSERRSQIPLILSGGLGPDNVARAIAQIRPFAVDSASATERAPGHKDPEKLQGLFKAVRGEDPQTGLAVGEAGSEVGSLQ